MSGSLVFTGKMLKTPMGEVLEQWLDRRGAEPTGIGYTVLAMGSGANVALCGIVLVSTDHFEEIP